MSRAVARCAFVVFIGIMSVAPPTAVGEEASVGHLITMMGISEGAPSELLKGILDNPEIINKAMDRYLSPPSGWRLLKDLNLRFKTFRSNDDTAVAALGFTYSFSKDVRRHSFEEKGSRQSGISLSVSADGNVAFDKNVNPVDFLESDLSLHVFRSYGGAVEVSDEVADELDALESLAIEIEDQDSLDNHPAWRKFFATHMANLTTQVYVDLSLLAALESNQAFTQKHYVYGARLGFEVKPWNRQSTLAQWNLLDWPFAAMRWLSQTDESFSPRGSSFPTVLLGINYVEPETDDLRAVAGETSGYPRFKAEVAFKTLAMRTPNQTIFFSADVRYYKELGASSAIEAANIEDYSYFVAALQASSGPFVSYSTGKLPFDATDDQVFELGFRFSFD